MSTASMEENWCLAKQGYVASLAGYTHMELADTAGV